MQRPNDESVQSEGDYRVLNFGAVRIHNGHLQSGKRTTLGCRVCQKGLEGVMETPARREKPAEVAPRDGGHEKDDPALAHGSGDDWPE